MCFRITKVNWGIQITAVYSKRVLYYLLLLFGPQLKRVIEGSREDNLSLNDVLLSSKRDVLLAASSTIYTVCSSGFSHFCFVTLI